MEVHLPHPHYAQCQFISATRHIRRYNGNLNGKDEGLSSEPVVSPQWATFSVIFKFACGL